MNLDLTTVLASAGWPVLLVNNGATLLSANASAQNFFGASVSVGQPQLEAFWSAENGCAVADFFVLWTSMPTTSTELKFRGANGAVKTFFTVINAVTSDGETHFLLQLFAPETGPLPATKIMVPAKPAPVVVAAAAPAAIIGDAALKQKLDCVLQLARTVSLDLNNALTGVLAHASWLLDRADADHPWRHSLVEVEKSSIRAAEISAELAAYSRKEKEPRQTPPGNLNLIVSRCAEFFRNAHEPVFDWRLKQEPALNGVCFDEAKLQQALTKVFENAVEAFVGQHGGIISIETQNVELTGQAQDRNVTLAAGNYVCVSISDTGAGMAEDVATRAFEPFFTTKSPPHRGLGLALVYGIVTNHGGGVAISSFPSKGTSVRIYLPAVKNAVSSAVGQDQDLRGSGTILVVDDEALVLTMAEMILSSYGYKVLTANSSANALALLTRPGVSIDLVVTDLVMPGMGGRELAERIRQAAIRLPVLCISGYIMPLENKTGANYLQKPFTSRQLLSHVKAALAG